MNKLPLSGDPFPTPYELQAMYEAALRKRREQYGAAPTTVEAVMYELRTKGLAALRTPNCQRRLSDLSAEQVHEVIERLECLRPKYTEITDELLLQISESGQ